MNAHLPTADDGWIEWTGGECPVADDAMVQTQFRCETRDEAAQSMPERAGPFIWDSDIGAYDIIAYRVVKP